MSNQGRYNSRSSDQQRRHSNTETPPRNLAHKAAGVNVGVQIKPTKIKDAEAALSNLMDVVGIIFSFLTEDVIGGGVGLVFEAMYRTNWYSSKPFFFMVKDWEPCKGHWQGTITYTTEFKEVGSAENIHLTQSWDDESFYQAEIEIPGRRDDQGFQIARVRATAREKKTSIGTGKGVCFRTTTQVREISGSESVTTGFSGVTINTRTRQYTLSAPIILVNASGSESVVSKVLGTCNNPFNKGVTRSSPLKYSLDADGPKIRGEGTIDPNNPDVMSGTDSITVPTNRGGKRKVTITWNLRKCQDH